MQKIDPINLLITAALLSLLATATSTLLLTLRINNVSDVLFDVNLGTVKKIKTLENKIERLEKYERN